MPSSPPLYDPSVTPFGMGRPKAAPPVVAPEPASIPAGRIISWVVLASILGAALSMAAFQLLFDTGADTTEVVSLGGGERGDASTNLALLGEPLDVQTVLARVSESVVAIETNQEDPRGLFGGAGSGVLVSEDGLILTNEHVIRGADEIEVTFFNGLTFPATLVGSSIRDDIALLQAEGVTDTQPAVLGSVETLRVGDEVLAIGNALGFGGEPTVTLGIVSAKNRTVPELDFQSLIQTDAAINPGNSGGPLVNAAGEVVGINTAIIEGAQNIGFAISIDSVLPLIDRLLGRDAELTPEIAFLGASSLSLAQTPPEDLTRFGVTAESGAFIVDVINGSAAAAAGLVVGDVVTHVDGVAVSSPEEVARAVRLFDPGQIMQLEIVRDGLSRRVAVTLGERPSIGN